MYVDEIPICQFVLSVLLFTYWLKSHLDVYFDVKLALVYVMCSDTWINPLQNLSEIQCFH